MDFKMCDQILNISFKRYSIVLIKLMDLSRYENSISQQMFFFSVQSMKFNQFKKKKHIKKSV